MLQRAGPAAATALAVESSLDALGRPEAGEEAEEKTTVSRHVREPYRVAAGVFVADPTAFTAADDEEEASDSEERVRPSRALEEGNGMRPAASLPSWWEVRGVVVPLEGCKGFPAAFSV